MDITAALEALRAVRVLEAIASGNLTTRQLDMLGYRDAGSWTRLAEVYFGPTRHRRLQEAARRAGADLSLDALRVVERHTRKLLPGAAVSPWELRVELCALRGTVAEIDRQAAARVRELNRAVDDAETKAYGRRSVKGGKNTDALGLRTITMTGPERHITALLAHLRPTAEKLRRADPRLSHEQALFDAVFATGTGPAGPVPPVPLVVATVPDGVRLLRREGDDTLFGLSDGTTMTGTALVEQIMADHHYVGLYDPVEGPVDLYRSRRTASTKQRILLAGESLLCEGPECTTPADECEVHHLTAWSQGGDTNVKNLTMVCRVHNARNDDDPHAPPRNGRLERRPGGVVFIPPDGGPPRTNRYPLRRLSARGLLNA
mgnify:FL=1